MERRAISGLPNAGPVGRVLGDKKKRKQKKKIKK